MIGFVYTYCKVSFGDDKEYYYRTFNRKFKVGDSVIVPVGKYDAYAIGTIKETALYKRNDVPFPLRRTKTIASKAGRFAKWRVEHYNKALFLSLKKQNKQGLNSKDELSWIDTIEEFDAFMN